MFTEFINIAVSFNTKVSFKSIDMAEIETMKFEKGEHRTQGIETPLSINWREYCISLRFPLGVTHAFRQYAEKRGEMVPIALNDIVENKVESKKDDKIISAEKVKQKKNLKVFRGIRKFFKRIFSKRQK